MIMGNMVRMWINQPSALNAHHSLHGVNVLVDEHNVERNDRIKYVRIYPTTGAVISMLIDKACLSKGWRAVEPEIKLLVADLEALLTIAHRNQTKGTTGMTWGDMRGQVEATLLQARSYLDKEGIGR